MNKRRSLWGVLLAVISQIPLLNAMQRDMGFSGNGIATLNPTSYTDFATAVAIQADGKIVVGGFSGEFPDYRITMIRYNADGTVDTGFGDNGLVRDDLSDDSDELGSLVIQSDGSILVGFLGGDPAETPGSRNLIARYTADGVLDDGFGDAGILVVPDTDINFGELIRLDDDSLLVCGKRVDGGDIAYVAKYDSAGVLDDDFGANGIFSIDLGLDGSEFLDIKALSDGSIIAAGWVYESSGMPARLKIAAVKLSAAGERDLSFGSGGVFTFNIGEMDSFTGMIRLPDDDVLIMYDRIVGGSSILRLHPDGHLDTAFGNNGVLKINSDVSGLLSLPNGKIMITGQNPSGDAYLQVYKDDGSLDTSFGDNGTQNIVLSINSRGDVLLLQDDGKIVLSGALTPGDYNYQFLTMRFNDPDPDMDGVMDTDNCPNDPNPSQNDVCGAGDDDDSDNDNSSGGGGGGGGGSADLYFILMLAGLIRLRRARFLRG